jgi:hypothetical protein
MWTSMHSSALAEYFISETIALVFTNMLRTDNIAEMDFV